MTLNEASGNMFKFIDATWSPVAGACPHECGYCYVNSGFYENMDKYSGEMRIHESCLRDDLSRYDSYFVENMGDMFATKVPVKVVNKVLRYCGKWPENTYLFLTKNTRGYLHYIHQLPKKSILGTTIETNREYEDTEAPSVYDRQRFLSFVPYPTMVSMEPIMDFDYPELFEYIDNIDPDFVAIGADSQNSGLDEPESDKVIEMIEGFQDEGITTHLKSNIERVIGSNARERLHQEVEL